LTKNIKYGILIIEERNMEITRESYMEWLKENGYTEEQFPYADYVRAMTTMYYD
jgi:hypothetical protein